MAVLEEPNLASIDSTFDDDHFVCCQIEKNFTGITTAFCGAPVLLDGTDHEYVDEVSCKACNDTAEDEDFCPLKGICDA